MDRTTVRLILLVIGVLVIAGVYFWPRIKPSLAKLGRRKREDFSLDDDIVPLHMHTHSRDEGFSRAADGRLVIEDDLAFGSEWNLKKPAAAPSTKSTEPKPAYPRPPASAARPEVVQLSVIAAGDVPFSGPDLLDAFRAAGLEYGEMGIFHRRDPETGGTLFSVASVVEPGVFPHEGMENFSSPGVVLFYLPSRSGDALSAFDTMIAVCHELARRLNGVEWDAGRRPLTPETVSALRLSLL
ncbi:MAG TPA: cell division protein ZipA C-terminal FtsZ-binding domain-containing protein [Methylococcaceae bacterium]|nr:cell division protein ZipA C-terminal FtsZ-binding domain-containing protein [Methylococcaceae bacterium]